MVDAVERCLDEPLASLPTREVAREALSRGFAVEVSSLDEAAAVSDRIAAEHVALHVEDPAALKHTLRHGGAFFSGERAAEVFGDYGVGPTMYFPPAAPPASRAGSPCSPSRR